MRGIELIGWCIRKEGQVNLYAAAKNPLFFQRFEQYDHNSLSFYEGETIIQSIRQVAEFPATN